jgi:hypothetical protein
MLSGGASFAPSERNEVKRLELVVMNCKEPFNWEQMLSYYWWKIQFFKVTGGRPMIDCGFNFVDKVSGKSVRNYTDRFGRKWMADSGPWSIFRVRRNDS